MRKTAALLSLLLVLAFGAYGCATASPAPEQTIETIDTAPSATPETTEPEDAAGTDEQAQAPQPMTVNCSVPEEFAPSENDSTASLKVYTSDTARIQYGYEQAEGATPEDVKAALLDKLPQEPGADGFQLTSTAETTFGSYPGFIFKWTTGSGDAAVNHEAHFILTDGYTYRAEYAVNASSAAAQASGIEAFFNSVQLTDTQP